MSLITAPDEIVWDSVTDLRCFYCGDALTFPAVHWAGSAGHIYWDPPCLVEMFLRLAVDVYVAERSSGRRLAMS